MEDDAPVEVPGVPVKMVTRRQVAEMLRVSERTTVRLTEKGILPTPLRVGRGVRWIEADIVSAIRRLSK